MTNKKNQKFNTTSKSKGFFPIQLHRFNTDKHPIRKSAARCSAKLKANVSQQEELMAGSLPSVLQCPEREAIRIALYELINYSDLAAIEELIPACLAVTKLRGHTSRDRSIQLSLPPQEKADALELADQLGVTDKELLRLAVIYLAKGIRSSQINRLTNSPKISQDKLARQWSREHQGKPPSEQTKALKKAAKDAYDEAAKLGAAAYEWRGQIFDEMNADGGMTTYQRLFQDEDGKTVLDDYVLQAFAALQGEIPSQSDLEDGIEQLAEDRRKAAYLSRVEDSWLKAGVVPTDEDLEEAWKEYQERKAYEQWFESLSLEEQDKEMRWDPDEPTLLLKPKPDVAPPEVEPRFREPIERRPDDWFDQKPEETGYDYYLRIAGQEIVDRMWLAPEPQGACNRWWLRLTKTQHDAAKAIESEDDKGWEHITMSEIRAKLDEQA
jgi:hypothetical protein